MYNGTYGLHHMEFHTINPTNLIDLFTRIYDFDVIGTRFNSNYSQWYLESNQCNLIISSVLSSRPINVENSNLSNSYDILTSIINDKISRNLIIDRDTVFNAAVHVKSIETILKRNSDVEILVPHRQAKDEYGTIEYACIKSCIGNVVHTLIDTSKYSGHCLPGFTLVSNLNENRKNQSIISSIDHIAFAIPKQTALSSICWYDKVLGMKRIHVNKEDDPFQGFSIHVGTMGMRLFASEYWKCSETGCINQGVNNLKFVFAESLIEDNCEKTDQITNFIMKHQNQAGIQHFAFTCFNNIKNAVRIAKTRGAQILTPCVKYYSKENNGSLIESAGESIEELSELGILLDDEADSLNSDKKILLQVFTKSIFDNNTFFLELIERRGAIGFGSGNVRALWKIVQEQMTNNF